MAVRKTQLLQVLVLVIFVCAGLVVVWQAQGYAQKEIPSDPPTSFQKTMKPSVGPYVGVLKINMTPTKAFVIGDLIRADIEVQVFGVIGSENETCMVELLFPDAICYTDSWSNFTRQEWTYVWWEYQTYDATHAIYQESVHLFYVHEGYYGVNATVWIPKLSLYNEFSFSDLVQVKSYTYLEEQRRNDLTYALNAEVIGLTIVFVGPVIAQIIGLLKEAVAPQPATNTDKSTNDNVASDTLKKRPQSRTLNKMLPFL
jgi:hypothetical protein